jgi:hypothetical protein
MKPVGEPDAVAPHVRFDERGWETGRCRTAQATAPILDSTEADLSPTSELRPRADLHSGSRFRPRLIHGGHRDVNGEHPHNVRKST